MYIREIKTILILFIAILFTWLIQSYSGWVESEYKGNSLQAKNFGSVVLAEENLADFTIKQHLVSQCKQSIKIKHGDKTIAVVKLETPVIVSQAEKQEKWGFFQFPDIYRNEEGNLIVEWQMGEDSFKSYGEVGCGRMMSKNEGKTWEKLDKDYFRKSSNRVELLNGDILQDNTQAAKDVLSFSGFPQPVNKTPINDCFFYHMTDLPNEFQGAYLRHYYSQEHTSEKIHVVLDDPDLLRFSQEGLMAVLWLGGIKELKDGSLIAGVYPSFYLNNEGNVLSCGISFYKSYDAGIHWKIIGKIPYQTMDDRVPKIFTNIDEGFFEPAYEVINDSMFFCVMRSGTFKPLYKCYSMDSGYHWTKPEPFTPNGVKPRLLKLGNGVMVLSSGRPGVQLRFNIDGVGKRWTEPIEMMPFMDKNDCFPQSVSKWETCGYTGMLAVNDHTFYMVYTDFRTKNKDGEDRKAIMFRKISVVKK